MSEKKISIKAYIAKYFDPDGAPCERTVRRWCERQEIKATKIGARWYVIVDNKPEKVVSSLVAKVLAA